MLKANGDKKVKSFVISLSFNVVFSFIYLYYSALNIMH